MRTFESRRLKGVKLLNGYASREGTLASIPFNIHWMLMAVCLMVMFAASCVASPTPRSLRPEFSQREPIEFNEGQAPEVSIARFIVEVPTGTVVGAHYDGLLKVHQGDHVWMSSLAISPEELKDIAIVHISGRGYVVPGAGDDLFKGNEAPSAHLQLGGVLKSAFFDTFAWLAGDYSDALVQVEWQLYDSAEKEKIYALTTTGYGRQSGVGTSCLLGAFKSAIDNLLAEVEFVDAVQSG